MPFQHLGPSHSVARITGPGHNYLAITFAAEGLAPEPRIIELPPAGGCQHRPLDRDRILAAVLAGVEQGNRESGAGFAVAWIRFVADDTGPEEVYRSMARSLVVEAVRHQAEAGVGLEDP